MNRKIGVILSYLLMIFEVLSTLLLTPFIIRTLGQAEFGVYKLSMTVTGYLLLLDLGVGNAIVRFIAKYKATKEKTKERQFFGVAIIFYGIIGIISFIVGLILIKYFPKIFSKGLSSKEIILGQKLLFLTTINISITLMTSCYNNIILAYEKYKFSRLCSIGQIIFKIIATYVILILGYKSIGIVFVTLISLILSRIVLIYYVIKKIKLTPIFSNIDKEFIKEIVLYSSLIFIQMVATQLNASIDSILLGSLVTSSTILIGIYSIGTQISQYYQSIGSAFNGVLMAGIVNMVEDKERFNCIRDEMIRIGRIIFMVLGLIWSCFFINGKTFIILWAGKENIMSYYVAIILMSAYIFILTESIGTQILWALNEHKEQAYLKMVIVLLNIVLTVFLIKWNPLIGATIGTFVSLILGDIVVMNFIFKRKLKMDLFYYYKHLFKGIILCVILTCLSGYFLNGLISNSWMEFCIKNLIMVIIYGICMLNFGMNNYEKNLILSIIKMKRR